MDKASYVAFFTINAKLNRILSLLGDEIMPELDALAEQVTRIEASADAVAAKIQQLIDKGQTGNIDPVAVQGLVDRLKAVGDKLETAAAPIA